MRNRLWFFPLAILVVCSCWIAPPAAANSKVYGLVIGINDYPIIGDLEGAVNDANDIANAIKELPGAEVTKFTDGEATREVIFEAWRQKALAAQPGDTLIVTFAGHGGQEPEAYPGNELDGQDETLLLSSFGPNGASAAHRIRDDEIAELIALAHPGVSVIFLADSCHSGTAVRTVRQSTKFRYYAGGKITDDPLPPPPPRTRPDDTVAPNTIFLSAVADDTLSPEFHVDGEIRGALSLAFADAIRGDGDANRDGSLTKVELERYVRETVKGISRGMQDPQIGPVGNYERPLVSLPRSSTATVDFSSLSSGNPFETAFEDLPAVTVHYSRDSSATFEGGVQVTQDGQADLVVDLSAGGVFSATGDKIAELPQGRDAVREIVQRKINLARMVAAIREREALHPLEISFQSGNRLYSAGEEIIVRVNGRETRHIWLVHVSPNGEMNLVFPLKEYGDPMDSPAHNSLGIPFSVSDPYGADTLIALEVSEAVPSLDALLKGRSGTYDLPAAWNDLRVLLAEREDVVASVFSFYTAPF